MTETHKVAESLKALLAPIANLTPDPANLNTHGQRSIDSIAASLHRFGMLKPIVVRRADGIVIAGNGTLAAAKSLGWTHVAVSYVDHDTTESVLFAIADNRTAQHAEWDGEALASVLSTLDDQAIEDVGFTAEEAANLLSGLDPLDGVESTESSPDEPPADTSEKVGEIEFRVVVPCDSEEMQGRVMELLDKEGIACQPLML